MTLQDMKELIEEKERSLSQFKAIEFTASKEDGANTWEVMVTSSHDFMGTYSCRLLSGVDRDTAETLVHNLGNPIAEILVEVEDEAVEAVRKEIVK